MSNVGGVSTPNPGFYSYPGTLPAGLGSATLPTKATPLTALPPLQQEYNALNQADTAELLYASFLTPAQGIANANNVLQQAAALQDQQLAAQHAQTLANANADVTGSSSTSSTALASDVSKLPSVSNLLAQSDSVANAVLANYATAPAGSTIVDYQA